MCQYSWHSLCLTAASTQTRLNNRRCHVAVIAFQRFTLCVFFLLAVSVSIQLAQSVFDRGLYSDTLASLRVLREYLVRAVGGNTPQKSFCRLFSLSYPKMEQLVSTLYAIHRYVCNYRVVYSWHLSGDSSEYVCVLERLVSLMLAAGACVCACTTPCPLSVDCFVCFGETR